MKYLLIFILLLSSCSLAEDGSHFECKPSENQNVDSSMTKSILACELVSYYSFKNSLPLKDSSSVSIAIVICPDISLDTLLIIDRMHANAKLVSISSEKYKNNSFGIADIAVIPEQCSFKAPSSFPIIYASKFDSYFGKIVLKSF